MAVNINNFGDCSAETRGTGLGDCMKQNGDVKGIDIVKKRWSLDLTLGTLDQAFYQTQIQSRQLYPLNKIYNFEQNTPDTERATGSTGLLSDIRKGKPQYKFNYDSGYCFHKNITDKEGKDRWDVVLKFETGAFFATNVSETEIRGFDNGLFSVDTFKFQQGSDPEMSGVTIQFNNAVELNTRGVFLTWNDLGFDGNLENGAINTIVKYTVTPTATNEVKVQIVDDCNRSVNIQGLANVNNFLLGGTQATATALTGVAIEASTNSYVLQLDNPLAAGDTVQVTLGDVTNGYTIAKNASGDFYTGKAGLVTI